MTRLRKPADTPLLLGAHHETILRTVSFYRFMTALDVTQRLYSPSSLTHTRGLLTALAGGADYQPNQYLYRFPLPQVGKTERVYTLGSRGRDYLANELGVPVRWYFRPHKVKHFSLGHVMHQLTLTRFLCAAHRWCVSRPEFALSQERISYELEKTAARLQVTHGGKTDSLTVIPDAWLLFEEFQEGAHRRWLPVLVEIDRGAEYRQRFQQHVRSRIEFIRSGAYQKLFGEKAVTIAYATTGQTPEYRETRRASMCAWTTEVLAEQQRERWASVFRFSTLFRKTLYDTPLFQAPVWYRPDEPDPVPLFTP